MPGDAPTRREWMKALIVIGVIATLTTAILVWLAFAFLFQPCCVSPTPVP